MPFPSSTALPISVTVNDIPAGSACASEILDLAAGAAATDSDPTSLTNPGGLCPYVFSPYRTPLITAASGLPAGRLPATLTLSGRFLTTVASRIKVTVGGELCTGVTLLPAGALGSNLFCQVPSLPGNSMRTIMVEVEGLGFARAAPTIDLAALSVRFPFTMTAITPQFVSWGGGFDVTITGNGFVPLSGPLTSMGRYMLVFFGDNQIFPGNVSSLDLQPLIVSGTATQFVIRFPRIFSDSASNWDIWKAVTIYLCDTNAGYCTNYQGAALSLVFDDNSTPVPTAIRPATVPVSTTLASNIMIDWRIESAFNLNISYPGNASRVSISLTPTPTIKPAVLNYSQPFISCNTPTVVTSFLRSNLRTYNETLTCSLPPGTPANTYTVWLCLPNTGCENAPGTVTVPLSISGIAPRRGSFAGGINITITGAGFALNASFVSVWFGPAPCTVVSASFTSVTCTLGSALNASSPLVPSAVNIASLTVSPSEGAPNQTFALTTTSFTFDPAVTPIVNSASLSRGSTEGGTNLAFSVSGFDGALTTDITITLGTIPCTNVALSADAATLTCTTPKPPGPKPLGPRPVLVAVAGRGLAASTATYEYVDLWSRQTTWGGGPPPVEGSLAYIPANTTVLLDVNPPTLGLLVVEGTLLFDDTVPDIELRVKYILVRGGGTLSVGTEAVPYAGRARITIVGLPHVDPELPLYGSKVLAVRDGTVILHGQHKEPSWTRLAATANVNATTITLNATVNWQAGDTIAIASSSFFTDEAETATIVSVVNGSAGNGSTVVLDRRLNFTHLGVVEQLAGGRAGSIDMRAEVAVLSRNVVFQSTKYLRRNDRIDVNGGATTTGFPSLPPPTVYHGASYYNKSFSRNSWWWGNSTYNDTKFTVFLKGDVDNELRMKQQACPIGGCSLDFDTAVDLRGTLYWSDANTWLYRNGGKPQAGENFTVPFGWNLIIDEDTAPINELVVLGNLTFMPGANSTLIACYIFVLVTGNFYVGSAASPFTSGSARIRLTGGRASLSRAVDSSLVLGSKFLAVFRGGTLDLHGRPVGRRWTRLGASALPGATNITLATAQPGWPVGANILITSSSYNVWQTEERTIVGVLNATNNGTMLLLDSPLIHPHYSWVKAFNGSSPTAASAVDMRAEVALLSSNVVVESAEGAAVDAFGGEYFGCRIVASGPAAARMSNVALRYCGQSGMERPAVLFDRLSPLSGGAANPSFLRESVIYRSVEGALALRGSSSSSPVNITSNVMYYSYDQDTVAVETQRNYIIDNLVLGTVKNMVGNSDFDPRLPASFLIEDPFNFIEGNVAGGSERLGFYYPGLPCSALSANRSTARGSFLNNTAHSNLAGMRLLSSPPSEAEGCTGVANFTSYMAWDFDIITVHGIETDVLLRNINILNSKHAGILILKVGEMTQAARVDLVDSIVAGRTHPEVCGLCATNAGVGDPGCHPKLSIQSYNKAPPFSPSVGLVSSVFAVEFTKGPEHKPWDGLMGYQTILGVMYVNRTTFADFQGPAACGGSQGAYAIGNHPKVPDAFHPHYFTGSNVVNVLNNGTASGLFLLAGPDPAWRNEADCGFQTFNRSDGSVMLLNCAGPKHIHFRDLDGRLTGQPSTIVGFNNVTRTFPYDQAAIGTLAPPCRGPVTLGLSFSPSPRNHPRVSF
ncbi:Fibrocystin-L [Tetrabaena socialis]|uniref:Fibrocystin-L n=1 Tax=Tetrabaena socialis TaxID=47790 RepID=A0A2J8A5S6_9CHLO|nr:Fibrocystin-L [Tetrabaena socialis]|eukprot:PNH07881.1 Fibrocystin-L [Tetrabaena socialis]